MSVKLLTEHLLEVLSLKGGCTGSPESTHVKMPHCWKSHAQARIISCADPGIFDRGGGGSRLRRFLVLSLFYRGGGQWFYCRENNTFPRIQRGSNIFRGGPFKGDPNANCYHNNL